MSAPKYRYGHGTSKRRPRKALLVFGFAIILIGLLGAFVFLDLNRSVTPVIEGEGRVVSQVLSDNSQKITIDEPFFSFELPSDWKEVSRNENAQYNSINFQATAKEKDNRYLTVYVDRIPFDKPFNRIVTVRAIGNNINYSDVSDNCANFTVGGAQGGQPVSTLRPLATKWNKVDFICNLPQLNDNQVGTASEGSPNAVTVTGATKGAHKYFFLYSDRNYQPDYNIFYDMLESFKAK